MTETSTSAVANIKVKVMNSVEIPILTRCCFCVPLRKGLIAMAYINLVLTGLMLPFFSYYIFNYNAAPADNQQQIPSLLPQLIIEFLLLSLEFLMTLVFIVGLHTKKVRLMRVYLYFGIAYLLFCTVYNVVIASTSQETVTELSIVIAQLIIHFYFLIVVWSSIVKMSRDGSVKYTRSQEDA